MKKGHEPMKTHAYKMFVIWSLAVVLLVWSLPLTGCLPNDTSDSSLEDPQTNQDTKAPIGSLDPNTFSKLIWHDESSLMSLQDHLAASPFLTTPLGIDTEQDKDYQSKRQFLIQEVIGASKMMDFNTRNLLYDIDNTQGTLLDAYKTVGLYDTEFAAVYDMLKTTFAQDMQKMTLLLTQLDSLKEEENDDFIKAWNDYTHVYKTLELSMMTLDQITFIIQQSFIFDEALKQRPDLSSYHHIADTLLQILENMLQLENTLNPQLAYIAQTLENLMKIEQADAYYVLSKLEGLLEEQESFHARLQSAKTREGLTQEDIELAMTSVQLSIELLYNQLAQLATEYDLNIETANSKPWIPFVVYAHAQDPSSERANQALEKAMNELTPSQVQVNSSATPARGFFKTIKEGITKLPGALIEKASTTVYKYAFSEAAKEYGLDRTAVEDEFKRVEAEELRRIVEGQAGTQAIRDGIHLIEDIEGLPGEFATAILGKDSTSAKVIKEGSKFTIGFLTGSGKSLMTLLDPQASTGETTLALIDVAFCGIGSSKTAQNTLKVVNQNITEYASRKLIPISEFGNKLITPFSKAVTKTKDKLISIGTEFMDSAATKLTQSPKGSQLVQTLKNKATPLISSAKDKVDDLYYRTKYLADDATDFAKQQYDDMLRETTINNSLLDLAMELKLEDAIANYVKGLIYGQIPTLVDDYIPEFLLGKEELYQMAEDRQSLQQDVQGNISNTSSAPTTTTMSTSAMTTTTGITAATVAPPTSTTAAPPTTTTTVALPTTTTSSASDTDYWLGTFKGSFSEIDSIYGVEDISSHGIQLTVKEDSLHLTTNSANSILNSALNVTFTTLQFYAQPGYAGYRVGGTATIPNSTIQIPGEDTQDAHQIDILVYFWQDGIEGEVRLYHGTNRLGKMYFKAKK
jgi:hypothetical protein